MYSLMALSLCQAVCKYLIIFISFIHSIYLNSVLHYLYMETVFFFFTFKHVLHLVQKKFCPKMVRKADRLFIQ